MIKSIVFPMKHAGDDPPDNIRVLLEQLRPGLEAVHDESGPTRLRLPANWEYRG